MTKQVTVEVEVIVSSFLSSESLTVHYSLHLSGLESYRIILVVQCNILQCLCTSFSLNFVSYFNQTG